MSGKSQEAARGPSGKSSELMPDPGQEREALKTAYEKIPGCAWNDSPDERFPEDNQHQDGFEAGWLPGRSRYP